MHQKLFMFKAELQCVGFYQRRVDVPPDVDNLCYCRLLADFCFAVCISARVTVIPKLDKASKVEPKKYINRYFVLLWICRKMSYRQSA